MKISLIFLALVIALQGVSNGALTKTALKMIENGLTLVRTPGATNPVLVSALVSSAGVVSEEDEDFINGNFTIASVAVYSGSFNAGYWASAPKCWVAPYGATVEAYYSSATETTTSMQYHFQNMAGTEVATAFKIFCKGNKN